MANVQQRREADNSLGENATYALLAAGFAYLVGFLVIGLASISGTEASTVPLLLGPVGSIFAAIALVLGVRGVRAASRGSATNGTQSLVAITISAVYLLYRAVSLVVGNGVGP